MVSILGIQFARDLVVDDPRLSKVKSTAVVLGMGALSKNKTELLRKQNQGKVTVFVTAAQNAVEAYQMGFTRVFIVQALCRVNVQDVIDADNTLQNMIDQNMKVYMLADSTPRDLNALEAISELTSCIEKRDADRLTKVLLTSGIKIHHAADSILKMVKCANQISGLDDLRRQRDKSEKEKVALSAEIDSLNLKVTTLSEESGRGGVDKSVLMEAEGRLAALQAKYKELQDSSSKLEAQVVKLTSEVTAKTEENIKLYADLTSEQATLRKTNDGLKTQLETVKSDKTAADLELARMSDLLRDTKTELIQSAAQYNLVIQETAGLTDEFEQTKQKLSQLEANAEDQDLLNTIARLKLQLADANKEKMSTNGLKTIMPIIGSSFALNARKVICFKEVRPAIYMNTFISALNEILKDTVGKTQRRSYCIVVLDMMLSDFDKFKYNKKKFNINCAPVANSAKPKMATVINNFDVAFLKGTLKLQNYDYLFIVDRLGLVEPSVAHSSLIEYFMINSIRDISDFNLKGLNTIIFGSSMANLKNTGSVVIAPAGELYSMGENEREFRLYKDNVIKDVLVRSGVIQ